MVQISCRYCDTVVSNWVMVRFGVVVYSSEFSIFFQSSQPKMCQILNFLALKLTSQKECCEACILAAELPSVINIVPGLDGNAEYERLPQLLNDVAGKIIKGVGEYSSKVWVMRECQR